MTESELIEATRKPLRNHCDWTLRRWFDDFTANADQAVSLVNVLAAREYLLHCQSQDLNSKYFSARIKREIEASERDWSEAGAHLPLDSNPSKKKP